MSRLTLHASFALLIGALCSCQKTAPVSVPPVDVTVTPVVQKDVPVTQEWVASLHGFVDAQVRAQVSGTLVRQLYREGAPIHAGDPLFEIDPRPFQAALEQAQGALAQARALLGKSEEDVKRYAPLVRENAISQQEYDDAVQANLAAKAQVQSAQASVDTAALNLSFTRLVSPVEGVPGLIQAQIGDLVGPSSGPLTTVSTIDPMKVYFPISEQTYLAFQREHPTAEGFPTDISLTLVLSDGTTYPFPGKVLAVDRQIDPGTGTVQVAALFPNPGRLLRPGQYGRVRAVVRVEHKALLVPTRALAELQGSYQVALLGAGNLVHIQPVKLGPALGADTVVEEGLSATDTVIVEGIQKVKEGSPVSPKPYQAAP